MRAIILILILVVIAAIAAIATGMVDINQTREATAPNISATGKGIEARGGQTPAFEVETGSVAVGTTQANVTLPKVTVEGQPTPVDVPSLEVKRADRQPAENQTAR